MRVSVVHWIEYLTGNKRVASSIPIISDSAGDFISAFNLSSMHFLSICENLMEPKPIVELHTMNSNCYSVYFQQHIHSLCLFKYQLTNILTKKMLSFANVCYIKHVQIYLLLAKLMKMAFFVTNHCKLNQQCALDRHIVLFLTLM